MAKGQKTIIEPGEKYRFLYSSVIHENRTGHRIRVRNAVVTDRPGPRPTVRIDGAWLPFPGIMSEEQAKSRLHRAGQKDTISFTIDFAKPPPLPIPLRDPVLDALLEYSRAETDARIRRIRRESSRTVTFIPPGEIISMDNPFVTHIGGAATVQSSVPPFVEPPRPAAEPEQPVDTPSAAALRPLLADRERIHKNALDQVAGHDRDIADLERRMAALQVDRKHKQQIAAKAHLEMTEIRRDIDRLNGVSEVAPYGLGS